MSIKFTMNFNPDDFGKKLREAAQASAKRQIEERLRRAPCPVHRTVAKVRFQPGGKDDFSYTLSPCCAEGKKATLAALPLKRSA